MGCSNRAATQRTHKRLACGLAPCEDRWQPTSEPLVGTTGRAVYSSPQDTIPSCLVVGNLFRRRHFCKVHGGGPITPASGLFCLHFGDVFAIARTRRFRGLTLRRRRNADDLAVAVVT